MYRGNAWNDGLLLLLMGSVCVLGSGCDALRFGDKEKIGKRRDLVSTINEARSERRMCGPRAFEAAPPVAWNEPLAEAALRHSQDLVKSGIGGHQGSDGSTPAMRIREAGYRFSLHGEVVATGGTSADEVVAAWLDSPGHCAVIMTQAFEDAGGAMAGGRAWTVDFAAP